MSLFIYYWKLNSSYILNYLPIEKKIPFIHVQLGYCALTKRHELEFIGSVLIEHFSLMSSNIFHRYFQENSRKLLGNHGPIK